MKSFLLKFTASCFIIFILCGSITQRVTAQQTGIQKPPSVNCPVSLYDHARAIKANSASFGNQKNFETFYTLYKKFTSTYNSYSGNSYYVIKWNVPNNVGWAVEYYERAYTLPVFPGTGSNPTQIYPVTNGPLLPTPFSLSKEELNALNAIHNQVPSIADKLISDIWLLQFFETECGESINLANIPVNPFDTSLKGYGKTRANSQSFVITLDPNLWTATTTNSFKVTGEITAIKEVTPSLKIAYGADQTNLNFLAPSGGTLLFNSPLANRDVAKIPPLDVTISHISKDIKDDTVYFAIVDSKNPNLAYSDTQVLSLGGNVNGINYSLPSGKAQSAPGISTEKNAGIMSGICDGPTCGFNDLLKLFKNFWKFILILIVPIVAIMTAWIGYNFMQSGAEYREKAKEMTSNMIIGIILVFFAWFIVNTILTFTVGEKSCYSFLGKGKIDANCVEPNK